MPVKVVKRGSKYRVVEAATNKLAMTPKGNPRDGGGHGSRSEASAQARAINMHIREKA